MLFLCLCILSDQMLTLSFETAKSEVVVLVGGKCLSVCIVGRALQVTQSFVNFSSFRTTPDPFSNSYRFQIQIQFKILYCPLQS